MNRKEVVEQIMETVTNELVISSCGLVSREVFSVKDRHENFYVMGSMGAAIPISIGVALNTNRDVITIVGDGEVIMNLGALSLVKKLQLNNLIIHILDNNCFESTGGQKTISDAIDFKEIGGSLVSVHKIATSNEVPKRIPLSHKEITKRFMKELKC